MFAQQANRLVRSIGQVSCRREDGYDEFGVQHASIGVASRIKRDMDMDVTRKMGVKAPGSPDLLETVGLCQVFRGSLYINHSLIHVQRKKKRISVLGITNLLDTGVLMTNRLSGHLDRLLSTTTILENR